MQGGVQGAGCRVGCGPCRVGQRGCGPALQALARAWNWGFVLEAV